MTIRTLVPSLVAIWSLAMPGLWGSPAEDSRVCVGMMKTVACVPPDQIPPKTPQLPSI